MASVGTYLNFPRNTEEAFTFYKSVFGGEFEGGIHRMGEVPSEPGQPGMAEDDKNLIMHVCLPILGGHRLMGTDAPESMGFKLMQGTNINISLHPDTREEADRLYGALSAGGKVEMPLQDVFWGSYYASFTDKFGTKWMIDVATKK